MPLLSDLPLRLDVDAVLRGQGADPKILRQRTPRLVRIAERALEEGKKLLQPRVLFQHFVMKEFRHERILLEEGGNLSGKRLLQNLVGAQELIVLVCTVGKDLEDYASEVAGDDLVYSLALDGVGSAGVEALANAACAHFDARSKKEGRHTTIPLSPGMVGWSVEKGQPELFELINADKIGVYLSDRMVMDPRKSLSFVLGIGDQIETAERVCDICSLKETCRYQNHYAQ